MERGTVAQIKRWDQDRELGGPNEKIYDKIKEGSEVDEIIKALEADETVSKLTTGEENPTTHFLFPVKGLEAFGVHISVRLRTGMAGEQTFEDPVLITGYATNEQLEQIQSALIREQLTNQILVGSTGKDSVTFMGLSAEPKTGLHPVGVADLEKINAASVQGPNISINHTPQKDFFGVGIYQGREIQ